MPELPEVETIRQGLKKYLTGRTIKRITLRLPKLFSGDPRLLYGATVTAVRRFGKGLVIDFSNGFSLAVHIKMTGQLIVRNGDCSSAVMPHPEKVGLLPGQFTHVIVEFLDDVVLYYNDIRQFGWMKIVKTEDVSALSFFRDLGPEPPVVPQSGTMEGQASLTPEMFNTILNSTKMPIKPLLMDQKRIAGIGNIYANDALFVAGIDPRRPSRSLTDEEKQRLFTAIETVLRKGIEAGGASEWHYVNALGQTGNYQSFFQVYGKEGEICARCSDIVIQRIKQAGRSTFFCPMCQK